MTDDHGSSAQEADTHRGAAKTVAERHAAIAEDRADWLVDAVACATQDRRFLRGDPAENTELVEVLFLNAKQAISAALASAQGEKL